MVQLLYRAVSRSSHAASTQHAEPQMLSGLCIKTQWKASVPQKILLSPNWNEKGPVKYNFQIILFGSIKLSSLNNMKTPCQKFGFYAVLQQKKEIPPWNEASKHATWFISKEMIKSTRSITPCLNCSALSHRFRRRCHVVWGCPHFPPPVCSTQ